MNDIIGFVFITRLQKLYYFFKYMPYMVVWLFDKINYHYAATEQILFSFKILVILHKQIIDC